MTSLGYNTHNYWKSLRVKDLPPGRQPLANLDIMVDMGGKGEIVADKGDTQGQKMAEGDIMAIQANNRVNSWADGVLEEAHLLNTLQKGLVGASNAKHHKFRSRDRQKEMCTRNMSTGK